MSAIVDIANSAAVCIYGCLLAAAFCAMGKTSASRWAVAGMTLAMLALQAAILSAFGSEALRVWYPLITHLPLIACLWLCNGRLMWSFGSVMTAYLCCQLRRWLGLLAVQLLGGKIPLDLVELTLTLPMLALLLRFVAPPVSRLSEQSFSVRSSFFLIPSVYYVFDYISTVYTDWLYSGIPAVVEFMPFVCCGAYLCYVLYISEQEKRRRMLEADRSNLNIQIAQSVRELSSLRESQRQASTYRHDLRHHMQYLSACIENGEPEKAQAYIHGICEEIAAQRVVSYCENEEVNLILSAYAARAAGAGVELDIKVTLAPILGIAAGDLCVLLGNGLENALNACAQLPEGVPRRIEVRGHEKGGKLFLQLLNPCNGDVRFENGLPVAKREGHGIGARSIQAIVRRYGGICSFQVENGNFVLRFSL